MINSKNYYLFLIPYLTISCSLYQLIYWGVFGLNGLLLVSAQDILISTIVPIIATTIFSFLGYFLASKIFNPKSKNKGYLIKIDNNNKPLAAIILILIYGIIFFIKTLIDNNNNGLFLSFFLALIIASFINIDFVFSSDFQPKLNKEFLLLLIIYFPLNSIGIGFDDSYSIFKNKHYQYSIKKADKISNRFDTIKLLGKNDGYFIFTDFGNSKIFFIKSDTITLLNK